MNSNSEGKINVPEMPEEKEGVTGLIADTRLAIESSDALRIEAEHKGPSVKDKIRHDLEGIAEIVDHKIPGLEHMDIFEIRVNNQDRWGSAETAEKMAGSFGELAFMTFEPRDSTRVFDMNDPSIKKVYMDEYIYEIARSKKVHVIADKERVIGFHALGYYQLEDGFKVGSEILMVFRPEYRNRNIARSLLELIYREENVSAFASVTHTPAAVKMALETAKKCGCTGFYCGQKNGEFGRKGNEAEQTILRKMEGRAEQKFSEIMAPVKRPDGYWIVDKSADPIPPLSEKEVKFKEGDPLGETFVNGLLEVQKESNPHTVYGFLHILKNPMK